MRNIFRTFLAALLVASFAGCSSRPLTIIPSTSPLPTNIRGTIPASGSDCQYNLLGIIPVTSSASTQSALSAAKWSADVDVLTDVTIDENYGYYILFSNKCVRVDGMGVPRGMIR